MPTGIGLDIGGANLKAAHSNGSAVLRPFELWRRPAELSAELKRLLAALPNAERFAVTMTGELCDCFETKRQGVEAILDAVIEVLPQERVRIWSTDGRLLPPAEARQRVLDVAAANWHALATFAGRFAAEGPALLVDVGSTTTDIVLLQDGRPAAIGKTDYERLKLDELVYTGVRRTPVCALMGNLVMAELFATTLDVYLTLGMIRDDPTDHSTADQRPATRLHAHDRLAHQVGGDREMVDEQETHSLATAVFEKQRDLIGSALQNVVQRSRQEPAVVILSGSGEFLARAAWEDYSARSGLGNDCVVVSIADDLSAELSSAACAYALAILAAERGNDWLP